MPGTDVEFERAAGEVRLVKALHGVRAKTRAEKLVNRLRGGGDLKMATGDIPAMMRGKPAHEDEARVHR
jgi:hypothetical protein